jgi:glycosyltransferase involved in cell wall biosynthesis
LGLSVVVCCHNSIERLQPTFEHLARQEGVLASDWEVLLVDNASTDGTGEWAERAWREMGAPTALRVVTENKLGLINARIAGINAAQHDVLTFVDDDNWVCSTWCATILGLMREEPDVAVIGGRNEAVFAPRQVVPPWFEPLQHGYAVGPQGLRSGRVTTPMPRFYGAGLTVRRAALGALLAQGFSPLLSGRAGGRLISGDDSELCYALAINGCTFWYEDSLRLKHFMPEGRLTDRYAQELFFNLGYSSSLEDFYCERASDGSFFGRLAKIKRISRFHQLNAIRNLLRHQLRSARPAGDDKKRQAAIEASFFKGRLRGLKDRQEQSATIAARIARWTSPGSRSPSTLAQSSGT